MVYEGFMDTYLVPDKEEAKGYLAFWCDAAIDAKLEPFRKFGEHHQSTLVSQSLILRIEALPMVC